LIAFWQGDIKRCLEYSTKTRHQMPEEEKYDVIRGDNEIYITMSLQALGQKETAIKDLNNKIAGNPEKNGLYQERLLTAAVLTHLRDADLAKTREAELSLEIVANDTGRTHSINWSKYLSACCSFQAFDLDLAYSLFNKSLEEKYSLHGRQALSSFAGLAIICQYSHRIDEANNTILEMLEYAHESKDPFAFQIAHSAKARLLLLQNDLKGASKWLRSSEPPSPASFFFIFLEIPMITRCRVLVAIGSDESLKEANALSERLLEITTATNNIFHMIDVLVLHALALHKQSCGDEALRVLERAVNLAAPRGVLRPFIESGSPMVDLLEQLVKKNIAVDFIRDILAAFRDDETESPSLPAPKLPSPQGYPTPTSLIETLTNRELDILELLKKRLQNKEIAEKLFISHETVKGHLKNIYQKLYVGSRREAVEKAKELEII
jgi:LuxR family maltose regulon positive regulatory protein